MPQGNSNACFVIAPIGEPNSEIRKRSDQVFKHILQPASKECGYEAIRADHIEEPGIITDQVIRHIIKDPVIIADLTGRNPNVFYELAIRHVLRKPYVQIIQNGEEKPFDVAGIRTIEIDHRDLDGAQSAKDDIIRQINSIKKDGYEVKSPISVTVDLEMLRQSGNPEQRQIADILAAMAEVKSGISSIDKRLSNPIAFSEIRRFTENYNEIENLLRISRNDFEELLIELDHCSISLKELRDELDKSELDQNHSERVRMLIRKLIASNNRLLNTAHENRSNIAKILDQIQYNRKDIENIKKDFLKILMDPKLRPSQ